MSAAKRTQRASAKTVDRAPTRLLAEPRSAGSDALTDALRREMEWLSSLVDARFRSHFTRDADAPDPAAIAAPDCVPGSSRYADLVASIGAGWRERVLLALALAPHVAPHALDVFFIKNEKIDRGFTEFGGVKGIHHAGFIPTGETALFLICGDGIPARLAAATLFDPEQPLFLRGVLRLGAAQPDEPAWSSALSFSAAHLRHLVTGEEPRPELGPAFPAHRVTTQLSWDDLVLDPATLREVGEIAAWARHERELLEDWGLGRHLKRGFRALFHGPSGTGKTLTATLLGKEVGADVYRIDLSQVVSKYIGETEKNLAAVFAEASRRNWILFFDEADALFGKRTQTSSSNDRYANQEVAYLLQRIEDHPGIVILATNLKSNLDDAFARRFQAVIYFAPPDAEQRVRLWRNTFGAKVKLAPGVELARISREHEVTGGQIVNVVRSACLAAVQGHGKIVGLAEILTGIRREARKEGREG